MLSAMLPLIAVTAVNSVVLMQAPEAPAQASPQASPQVIGPEPAKRYDQGPMGLDLVVLYEQRFRFFETLPGNIPSSRLEMRFRLRGEGIGELVRFGNVSFDEAIDSAGKSLLNEADQTDEYRQFLRRANATADGLIANGLPLPGRLASPTRTATTIKSLKGSIRVVRATGREQIVIVDALQQVGNKLEHPRLAELGIEVTLLPPGNPTGFEDPTRALAMRLDRGGEKIDRVVFCDEWLRTIGSRPPSERRTNEGDRCLIFQAARQPFDDNTQMIIEVYLDAKDQRIPFSFTDVELP